MMNRERVIEIARAAARERGWPWLGRVDLHRSRAWLLFGARQWQVYSNADGHGCNARIVIDDATETIVRAVFLPR